MNSIISAAHKKGRDATKNDLRSFVLARPQLFKDILEGYEKAQSESYDFDADKRGVGDSAALAAEIVGKAAPLHSGLSPTERTEAMLDSVISTLRKLVEENKLSELLFNDDGSPKKEIAAQRLIFAIAEVYSKQYDVDLSREPNAGNGPADFKFSVGRQARILIEIKLSSHPRIREGFYAQLPAYAKSEGIKRLVLLVIQIDDSTAQISFLKERIEENPSNTTQLELVDARKKPSASKRAA